MCERGAGNVEGLGVGFLIPVWRLETTINHVRDKEAVEVER